MKSFGMTQEINIAEALKNVVENNPMQVEAINCLNRVHMYYTEFYKTEDGNIMCLTKEYGNDGDNLLKRHSFTIKDTSKILEEWTNEMITFYHLSVYAFEDLANGEMTATIYPCKGTILDV